METLQKDSSILQDVKLGQNGLDPEDTSFDEELKMHINTVFFKLNEIGVGPATPFHIESGTETWYDFTDKVEYIFAIKSYMIAEVRLKFDPPSNTSLYNALVATKDEYEWRLMNTKKEWRE